MNRTMLNPSSSNTNRVRKELSPTIFLSYAHEDEEAASRLCKDFKHAGINVWFDKESLFPGQKWKSAINKAIRECQYFLVIFSTNSVTKRGFIQKEIKEALALFEEFPEDEIFIIPVRLDKCEPSYEKLRDIHRADMFPDWEHGLTKILARLKLDKNISLTSNSIQDKLCLNCNGPVIEYIKKDNTKNGLEFSIGYQCNKCGMIFEPFGGKKCPKCNTLMSWKKQGESEGAYGMIEDDFAWECPKCREIKFGQH